MGKSAKKYTPGSNRASMSPEERVKSDEFHASMKYAADYLNRNVLLEEAERRPLSEAEQRRLDELIEKLKKVEADEWPDRRFLPESI